MGYVFINVLVINHIWMDQNVWTSVLNIRQYGRVISVFRVVNGIKTDHIGMGQGASLSVLHIDHTGMVPCAFHVLFITRITRNGMATRASRALNIIQTCHTGMGHRALNHALETGRIGTNGGASSVLIILGTSPCGTVLRAFLALNMILVRHT